MRHFFQPPHALAFARSGRGCLAIAPSSFARACGLEG